MKEIEKIIKKEFQIFKKFRAPAKWGVGIQATFPKHRYPYIYPRDLASASRMLYRLADEKSYQKESLTLLREISLFMLHCQRKDGHWGQRYDLEGVDRSIYVQEDNIAHAIIVLLHYVLKTMEVGEKIGDLKKIRESVKRGLEYALNVYYRQEINLFFSTTSVQETPIERGYTIWVNFAFLRALHMALKFFTLTKDKKESRMIEKLLQRFENNVMESFSRGQYYFRRYTPEGEIDFKPDVTLFSPFYFGFEQARSNKMENTVEFFSRHLWDPELGGLQRYLPFTEDLSTHIHAGNGPWMNFTAILAQYYYKRGDIQRGDGILNIIDKYRNSEGYIPEHISTPQRFQEFMEREWNTGLDFHKEFSEEILLDDIPFDRIVEELNHMKQAYQRAARTMNKGLTCVRFVTPLMWSHVEYILALFSKMDYLKGGEAI
jgi:GH15 family glucan-1,4-alpha-glucosidase